MLAKIQVGVGTEGPQKKVEKGEKGGSFNKRWQLRRFSLCGMSCPSKRKREGDQKEKNLIRKRCRNEKVNFYYAEGLGKWRGVPWAEYNKYILRETEVKRWRGW
ncbi:hypothetical protein TRVL_09805 [Trypanosoma vivax]|nr:hypothetical protein TRVL_09805 [Trypanosoma vivax]